MPTIPRYQRQVSPQFIPGTRVSPEEMTQDTRAASEFGKTALRVGAAVTDAGIEYQNALDNAEAVTQASKAAADTSIAFNDFLTKYKNKELDIKDYTNAEEVQKQFDDFKKNTVESIGSSLSNTKAQNRYRTWTQKEEVGWIKNLTDQYYTFKTDAALGNAIATIDTFIQAKDYTGLRKYLPELVAAKIITSAEAAKQLITARETIDKKIEQDNYDSTWNKATSQPNRDIAEGIVKESGLSADNEAKMITRLKTFYETQEIKKKEAEDQAVNQWEAEALKKFRTNTFSVTDIDTAPKGVDKVRWEDRLKSHNEALKRGEKSPFEERDPETYAQVSFLVNTEPDKITNPQIYSYVGKGKNKGFTTEDAERLVARRKANLTTEKPDDPLKADRAKRYHTLLREAKDQEFFGAKDTMESRYTYGEKANLLDAWFIANPDATDKEVEEYFKVLIEKEKSDFFGKMLDNFFTFGPMYPIVDLAAKGAISAIEKNGEKTQGPVKIDPETAAAILKEAGGDKNKARKIAKERGYTF